MLADFKADLLISQVRLGSKPSILQEFFYFSDIFCLGIGNITDDRLHWRQPQRECAFVMLDQNTDKALEGTEDRPSDMNNKITLRWAALREVARSSTPNAR